ncbi:hypothetical protein D3C76_1170660 [compost metagenome]
MSSYMVGMPPPPAQMTTVPFSSSHLIGRISKMRLGRGLATTRRNLSPSGAMAQPFSLASASASSFEYTGPIGLVGFWKAGSFASTSTWVRMVAKGTSKGSRLPISCSIM